ncbi:MAG: Spy/CpxP family protein refolding chaperone [Desulfobacterales bacterium]|jgi:Spy/CpxP family protein refolding chaperone|nr:Spy/CpxP family protein refolding chaperone [Desulfobacterales bacterium]
MKKGMLAVALVVILLGAVLVYAQGPGQGPGYGPGRGHGRCWESGDPGKGASLTDEQRAQLQDLRKKFHDETAQLRESVFAKRQELQSLWSDPKAETSAIMNKEKELRYLQDQMQDEALQLKLEARKILTPEQLSEFGGRGMGPGFGRGHGKGYGKGSCSGPCN